MTAFTPAFDAACKLTLSDMRREKNRKCAASALAELAERHGGTIDRKSGGLCDREISIYVRLPRAYALIHIGADTATIGAFLAHWNTPSGSADLFRAGWQGSSWMRPHHKATTCTDLGFGVFLAYLNQALRDVASGEAFANI